MATLSILLIHPCPIITRDLTNILARDGHSCLSFFAADSRRDEQELLMWAECVVVDSTVSHLIREWAGQGFCDLPILFLSQWGNNEDIFDLVSFYQSRSVTKPFVPRQIHCGLKELMVESSGT